MPSAPLQHYAPPVPLSNSTLLSTPLGTNALPPPSNWNYAAPLASEESCSVPYAAGSSMYGTPSLTSTAPAPGQVPQPLKHSTPASVHTPATSEHSLASISLVKTNTTSLTVQREQTPLSKGTIYPLNLGRISPAVAIWRRNTDYLYEEEE
jgi:hypothetical protein